MKLILSYDPWRDQPFFLPREAHEPKPLPKFVHLKMTVPGRKQTVRDALITLIDSASERVFVCSFLLGGEAMRDALRRAAKRLRGHVYVITALDDKSLQRSLEQESDEIDQDALNRERKNFEALTRHGVYVRGAENCHAKFCIVDDRVAFVGSANFDPNGLDLNERGAKPCGELGLVLESPERVAPLAALFRHLWKCGCQREAPPSPNGYRLNGVRRTEEPAPNAPTGDDAVVWTGFESTTILAGIQRVIAAAKRTLILASFSFTAMREKPTLLLDALADARNRGVEVELLLRDRSRDLTQIGALLNLGVEVRANRVNHAKYAIADGDNGLLFSANFDGIHGLTDGIETGVWLRPEEAREVTKWHSQMWRETPSYALRWDTSEAFAKEWPEIRQVRPVFLGERLSITGDEQTVERCKTILKGPCLFLSDGEKKPPLWVRLVGFNDAVRLEPNGPKMKAFGIDRNDALFRTLPQLIAMGHNRRTIAWLPNGLEVNLP